MPDVEATRFLDNENKELGSEQGGGRPAGPACVSSTRRAAANYLRAARPGKSFNCAREEEALRRNCDFGRGARYVPSSSSNNKLATAPPAPPLHRTIAAAAATAFRVGDSCGRRRASAATVVGCGTSTAARARRWRVLGRIVRSVSAARRAQGTHRIREKVFLSLLRQHTSAERLLSFVHLGCQAF